MAGLVNIGFGNMVNEGKLIAVVSPDAAPIKRLVQNAREIMETDYVVLSALQPDTIAKRFSMNEISESKSEVDA